VLGIEKMDVEYIWKKKPL